MGKVKQELIRDMEANSDPRKFKDWDYDKWLRMERAKRQAGLIKEYPCHHCGRWWDERLGVWVKDPDLYFCSAKCHEQWQKKQG